ncbi:hypothetical protein ACFYKX_15435 [Cytobacillus sp. FJAT-54145]|uniref:Plasmid segregation centromere-binding protein ParR n=1 Tax=Cytobacillus spartinae TaxID=3299023 RepID=A0ABW6KGM1_9BACI
MQKREVARIKRGQAITFRIPSNTPDHIMMQLQRLKETERRNFSSKMAEFILEGVNNSISKEKEVVMIPLPKPLTKVQRNWLKHTHSEALVGSIIYQLLADPVRATSILASLNSNSLDIDDALYLQEEKINDKQVSSNHNESIDEIPVIEADDDLENFNWEMNTNLNTQSEIQDEIEEEDSEDLLGEFLSRMNK